MSKKNFIGNLKHGMVPDVCMSFKNKDDGSPHPDKHSYRVTGWMKMVDPEALKKEQSRLYKNSMLNDILIDSAQTRKGKLQMWCTREEATHVTGYGVCGCIVAVEDIECDYEYIAWSKEQIDEARVSALSHVGDYIN